MGHKWGIVMNWWLNLFQKDHGFKAACGDLQRATNRVTWLKKSLGIQ